jgi:hypothetical protein
LGLPSCGGLRPPPSPGGRRKKLQDEHNVA